MSAAQFDAPTSRLFAASAEIAEVYDQAYRENLEDAANSAIRIVTEQNLITMANLAMGEALAFHINAFMRITEADQKAVEVVIASTRGLRRVWGSILHS
jgi:hypothetical protein